MFNKQIGKLAAVWFIAALSLFAGTAVVAAEPTSALYLKTLEAYPAPKLEVVDGREYKFLVDPAKTQPAIADAFKDLWTRFKSAATKHGYTVTEKEKAPLKFEMYNKDYYDTADQKLWNKGYLLRITTRFKDGKPNPMVTITVKSIKEDVMSTLTTPLAVVGVAKVSLSGKESVAFGPGGKLGSYIEKDVAFSVASDTLGKRTLGDFGKYMPELLTLGLPADTALVETKVFTYKVKPGDLVLPGVDPCGIEMEAWSASDGGAPYLYDVSFAYEGINMYAIPATHAAGEQFMFKVVRGELGGLAGADGDKWGGSKVRKLMNRPITASSGVPGPAAQSVQSLDQKYGMASSPAYIKHYETDKAGKVLINPYMQAASNEFPAILFVKDDYDWVMDAEARIMLMPGIRHPYGRTYTKAAVRPEDGRNMKVGTKETYGHPSLLAGGPGRISGEIIYDEGTNSYTISNKSGRYSKHNTDRTPEQLVAAATLIREVVDPGSAKWGPVFYLIEYAPPGLKEQLLKDPKVEYDDPVKKTRPHLTVMAGSPGLVSAEKPTAGVAMPAASRPAEIVPQKPAAVVTTPKLDTATPSEAAAAQKPGKGKKQKAAHGDDPS
ncbi:MAG: hypothetical protein NTV11_13435 [Rhodocyclales bacterium]|nr:hypothetical protein [Rhodocyclales bacterium]